MSKSTYNLLNEQELLKSNASNEEKIITQAKLDVFDTLDMKSRKQIKVWDIAYQLSKERANFWWIPNKIEIWWIIIDIDQNSYRNIFDNYKHFLLENNNKWIEWTDRALAQRLILDSNNMIVFENELENAQKAFDSLNQDNKYIGLIELLQKKKGNKDISLIKRTEKEQRKIENTIDKKRKELEERKEKKESKSNENSSEFDTESKKNKENKNKENDWIINIDNKENQKEELIIEDNGVEKESESNEILRKWLLVNRDNLADKIREIRKNSGFINVWKLEIQSGIFIDIKKNKKLYTEFLEKYLLNENDNKNLQNLDTQFAERLILDWKDNVPMDQKYWIQINNDEAGKDIKSEEELESEANKCEKELKDLWYNVEYIKINTGIDNSKKQELANVKERIEELEKKISELDSELKSKLLYSKEIDRVKKQDELARLKKELDKFQNDYNRLLELIKKNKTIYHIVRQKKQKEIGPQKILPPHIEPINPVIEPINPVIEPINPIHKKERNATISNVESIHLEEANHRAEELARKEYEDLGKLNLFNLKTRKPWERMKTYALRSLNRKQRRNRHLSSVRWNINLTREDVVYASDRHEMESNEADWQLAITRRLVSHQNPDIDLLCKEFLTTNMADNKFETDFNDVLRLDSTVMTIVGSNNMDFLASNILLKLKNEKAEYTMVNEISKLLVSYNPTTFQTELNKITGIFFNETRKNYPAYIQKILDNITDETEINKIIKHQQGLLNEDVKTLQMQLQLVDNTTGAYEIDNNDKEKSRRHKFGAWMDKHPYLTLGWSILAGTGILATWWLIGWVAWAATATWLIAAKIWAMTAAKKASNYTKEQKWQEKRLTHWLNIEKDAMNNIRTVMNNAPWWSWRRYKATRQFKLYQNSTQKNITDTTRLTDFINKFIKIPGTLPATESLALHRYITNWLARVDYYKKTWHNFVASQDKTKVEIDMRNLYTAITQWVEKLWINLASIKSTTEYTSLVTSLKWDYDTSMENFKSQRKWLELKYGIGAGMLYAGTAVWLQYVLGSWIFGNYPCWGGETVLTWWTEQYVLHDEIKSSLTNAWATQENITNIENALRNAPISNSADWYNQQAWWTIVKSEMGWQDTQLNSWMHGFMKDTLWTLNEWWVNEFQKQLLDAKINSLTSGSWAAKTAEAFLSSPKIGLINQWEWAKVLSNLQSWLSWKDILQFTAEERMKMGYYGHMFIGNDSWVGSRLMEEVTKLTTVGWTTIITPAEICNRHYWLDGIGMPVFANTFMEKMNPNKNEIGKPIETIDQDPVSDSNIVIADKNNPPSISATPTYNRLTWK